MTRLTPLTLAIAGWIALAAAAQTAQAGDRERVSFGLRIGSHHHRSGVSISYHKSDHHRRYTRPTYHHRGHTTCRYPAHRPSYHSSHYRKYVKHRTHPVYTRHRPVVVRHRPVVACPPPVVVHQRPVVVHRPSIDYYALNGWELLADGRVELALDVFGAKRDRNPHIGGPKIGMAIAYLMLGRDHSAATAMSRAVLVDPGAFDRVPHHTALRHKLARHAERLEYKAHARHGSTDDLTTAAALRLINDDYARAHALIHEAIARGDRRESTYALKRLIGPIHRPHCDDDD